jgi:hypothetical protein
VKTNETCEIESRPICRAQLVTRLRQVCYSEIVGYWSRYEYSSRPEFKEFVDSNFEPEDLALIQKRNFENESDNQKRYEMLRDYRFFMERFDHAKWWKLELEEKDIAKLLVIHDQHWYKLSGGTLKALDIAKTIDSQKSDLQNDSRIFEEKRKVLTKINEKVRERSRLVVVGPAKGEVLTVIDGVHRAVRLCLYYFVRKHKHLTKFSQPAYLGLTPDPIEHSS